MKKLKYEGIQYQEQLFSELIPPCVAITYWFAHDPLFDDEESHDPLGESQLHDPPQFSQFPQLQELEPSQLLVAQWY